MRVADLDRDMSHVIPTGVTRDSLFLFERMTRATLGRTGAAPGRRILDVASGVGQDARALAARGAFAVGVEPSARMSGLARLASARAGGPEPGFVRAWSDALPFADQSFDASYCKGSLDHFDRPDRAIAEMARVTRRDGCVVLAVANFESLALRCARGWEDLREDWLGRPPRRGRRHHDVPSDHFTRYDLPLMREQAAGALELDVVEGVSLAWGVRGWSRAVERLPAGVAAGALRALDWLARRAPGLSDVVVLAGRPRRQAGRRPARSEPQASEDRKGGKPSEVREGKRLQGARMQAGRRPARSEPLASEARTGETTSEDRQGERPSEARRRAGTAASRPAG